MKARPNISRASGALCALMMLLVPAFSVGAYQVHLEGVLVYYPNGLSAMTNEITLDLKDSQWAIRAYTAMATNNTHPFSGTSVTELSQDTNWIYSLKYILTNGIVDSNSFFGNMYSQKFPAYFFSPEVMTIFYAYASSFYLDTITNNRIYPIKFGPPDMLGERKVAAKIFRDDRSPNLPRHIDFFSFDGTYTNASLAATSFTNIAGLEIPLYISVTRFYKGSLRPLNTYRFEALIVKPVSGVSLFQPDLPKRSIVFDYRFTHLSNSLAVFIPFNYPSNWPTIAQSKARPEYKVTQMDLNRFTTDPIKKPAVNLLIVRGFLGCAFLLGIVVFVISFLRKAGVTTKTTLNE